MWRILPWWTRPEIAPGISSTSASGLGWWTWYRSEVVVPRRRKESSTAPINGKGSLLSPVG
jgi:hypothetical protein